MKGAGSESTGGWIIRGRTISCSDIQSIRELLGERPEASRWALAGALCERWQWRTDNGQWKIRSALGVLNGLAQRGLVVLPALRGSPSGARSARAVPVKLEGPGGTGLVGPVARYRPLRWELVSTAAERVGWRTLLDQYHYLGAPNLVGPNLKYRVYGKEGELLGALGWHSAVQHLGCCGSTGRLGRRAAGALAGAAGQWRALPDPALGPGAAPGLGDAQRRDSGAAP